MGKITAEEVKAQLAKKLAGGSAVDEGKGTDSVSVEKTAPEPTTASALGAEGASTPEPAESTAPTDIASESAVESLVPSEDLTSTGAAPSPDDNLRFEEFAARCMHFAAYMVHLAHGERPYGPTPTEEDMVATLDAVEYLKENPLASARDMHIRWMATKRQAGWVWGRVKDSTRRTHPLLIEFEQMSLRDKALDQAMIDGFQFAVYLRNTL